MEQRRVPFVFTTVLLSFLLSSTSLILPPRIATAKEQEQRKNACTFFPRFFPSLFSHLEARERRRKKGCERRHRISARISLRPYLSLPAFLPPLLFCLTSKTREGNGCGGRYEGGIPRRKGCAVASLMITQQKTRRHPHV